MATGFGHRTRMDVDARRMGPNGAWHHFYRLQQARWTTRREQSGIGELGHADGATQAGERHDPVSRDVFGGIVDFAASWISRAVPDRRNVSRATAGGPSASAQCVCRASSVLYVADYGKDFLGTIRWAISGTGFGTGNVYSSSFGGGTANGSTEPSFAGFDPHELWSGDDRLRHRSSEAGGIGLQRARAE